jgi:phospholipid/cholesterol/gamma-HCH transport system substrate-binding protein
VRPEMISFSERNPAVIGMIGVALTGIVTAGALQYKSLPFFDRGHEYAAYFAEVGGLRSGAPVQVAGLKVGQVDSIALEGARVLITFTVNDDVALGSRAEAAVKTKSLLGAKVLEVTPRGEGNLDGVIPLERTTPAYELPDALGDLSNVIGELDTTQLNDSLSTLAETFKGTPPDLRVAVEGMARFSATLNERDTKLRELLENAGKSTGVLAERSEKIVGLIADSNALLAQLRTQSAALDVLSANISALSQQVSGLIADNRETLRPALDKLNGALTLVDNHKVDIQNSIKQLNGFAMSLGESVASGPYFKAILVNLLPGQFIQPFVDAAFSDLGLDPNVLLPSERFDPQIGQSGTPALPIPFPRTGQGGDPHLTLPDAITGNPGDPRYPYREPLPAPPPGGPPPGPPALPPPSSGHTVPAVCPPCPPTTGPDQ